MGQAAALSGVIGLTGPLAIVLKPPPVTWLGLISANIGYFLFAPFLSIESVGFYSNSPLSQHYPAGLGIFYPSTGNFVVFVGNIRSRPLLHKTLMAFRNAGSLPSLGAALPNAVPGVGWSDHWSFWQQGFPGLEITDTALYRNPYYHTPEDTPDRLYYRRMARFAWAMQAVLEQLAGLGSS